MIHYLVAILVLFSYWFWKNYVRKPHKFPPGPARIPFVGSLFVIPDEVKKGRKKLQTWMQETYGSISGIYFGQNPVVVVSDYNLIKDLYKRYESSGRPINKPFHEHRFGSEDGTQRGLLQSSGQEWQEQRRFTMTKLKDIGFGKSSMEDLIMEEVDKLTKLLEEDVDQETSLNLKLNLSIVNALWLLLTGERFSLTDPKLKAIVSKFDSVLRLDSNFTPLDRLMNSVSPKLTKIFNKRFGYMRDLFGGVKDIINKAITKHKEDLDLDNPRDFMDIYLGKVQETQDQNSSFFGQRGEDSLVAGMLDLFLAGAETTSSSLLWAILFLLHHPEVQGKVHAEIDEVVGSGRRVTLEDRASLPYTNAVLMESMRMATIVPNALPHRALEDIEVNGYIIPKGATIFANLLHVHFDANYWKSPEEFNPNRFIDEDSQSFKANERLIPFSIGKRYCLGQSLAEKEYFLFYVGLLQKFQFDLVPNETLPKIGRESGVMVGILRSCPLYKTILRKRSDINE